jgi:hypothetical protein
MRFTIRPLERATIHINLRWETDMTDFGPTRFVLISAHLSRAGAVALALAGCASETTDDLGAALECAGDAACGEVEAAAGAAEPCSVRGGVATFCRSTTIGARYRVPDSWQKIVIKKGVTLKGNFIIAGPTRDFVVEGEGETSVLDNSMTPYRKGDRAYVGVRFENRGDLLVTNFKSRNPANFHITAWGPTVVDKMWIIDDRGQSSTDGVHSTKGVEILNSFISTYDDATYVGEASLIENTTIEHNANGAPLQISWGGNANGNVTVIKDCKFISTSTGGSNQGVVGWARKEDPGPQTVTLDFRGNNTWTVKAGANPSTPFYKLGSREKITNATIIQKGGLCRWAQSVDQSRNTSSVRIVTQGCR